MDGVPSSVVSDDGTRLGLLTAGSGPPLLLVHGGLGQRERWAPVWDLLTPTRTVTALDRRGRGSSGDTVPHSLAREAEDVAAVVRHLAGVAGRPVDVLGHSYGATAVLAAAGGDLPLGTLVLYEPPAAVTVPDAFVDRLEADVAAGRVGPAVVRFLVEVVGLTHDDVARLREAPAAYDVLQVARDTLPREARALQQVDLAELAAGVRAPVVLLLGDRSPAWARQVTQELARLLPQARVQGLPGQGHEAVDTAPELLVDAVRQSISAL